MEKYSEIYQPEDFDFEDFLEDEIELQIPNVPPTMLTPDFAPDPTDRQDFFHISASFYNNTMQPNTILDSVGCSQFTISGLFRNLNPKRWWLFGQFYKYKKPP